jgi:hypothetical protein
MAYPLKTDDFFPYADIKNGYWTGKVIFNIKFQYHAKISDDCLFNCYTHYLGYFTSKPALKLQERLGSRDLAVCKQVGTKNVTKLRNFRSA